MRGRVSVVTASLAVVAACGIAAILGNSPVIVGAPDYRAFVPADDLGRPSTRPGATIAPASLPTPSAKPTAKPVAPSRKPSATPSHSATSNPRPVTRTFTYTGRAMIGSSTGGSVSATQNRFPNMQVVRFYYPGAPTTWGGGIARIPSDQVIFVSFKYAVAATAAGGSDAAFRSVLRSWAASGRHIYWTWQHEADNPSKHISQVDYRAGWAHLLAVADGVPASNLHSMSILMGVALNGSHGPVEGWYVPGVDVLGFDCYYLDTELLAERYAVRKHKRVAFPEFGAGIGGSPDATSAEFARQFISALDSNTIAAVWFNNYGNNLSTHPQTLAVLRSAAG